MCVVSQVIFYSNRDKVVLHLYNTTQRILVNGHGYEDFIEFFLKPFFEAKVHDYPNEILKVNNEVIKKFGPKTVKRSNVKYKGGSVFNCNKCEFTFKTQIMLNKHKDSDHILSFNKTKCLVQPRQSTRNSSLLMLENIGSTGLDESLSLEEKALEFTCKDSDLVNMSKTIISEHKETVHENLKMEANSYKCTESVLIVQMNTVVKTSSESTQ